MSAAAPQLVFVVPYRDREQQQQFFSRHMQYVLADEPSVEIYYIHQTDTRSFNRGAIKNIGFLALRDKYPDDYKQMTFVFNDVDTMPFTPGFLPYETKPGVVKHFYGFRFALGGIVSITGGDFEKTGGFPNFWGWGYEDNLFQVRVLKAGLVIDRSRFYPLMDKNILQMKDGLERSVNKKEFDRYLHVTTEGYHTINHLDYVFDTRPNGDLFVDVLTFNTGVEEDRSLTRVHDLRKGSHPFGKHRGFITTAAAAQPPLLQGRRSTMLFTFLR
jgi:hypothetical protein